MMRPCPCSGFVFKDFAVLDSSGDYRILVQPGLGEPEAVRYGGIHRVTIGVGNDARHRVKVAAKVGEAVRVVVADAAFLADGGLS